MKMAWIGLLLTACMQAESKISDLYSIEVETIAHEKTTLKAYKGKVLLIVNVASKCGFTPQYEGLEKLYQQYKGQGLVILGFPSNQFGSQEPGSEEEIMNFCRVNYGVSFPMFAKIDVNGDKAHPLYKQLKEAQPGILGSRSIKWNFTKFLVDTDGTVLERYAPSTTPESIGKDIARLLKGK